MNNRKEELSAILAKAQNKLKTARIDFDNGQYEDAVSRAYYAVYHAMTAALFEKGLTFSSHGQVLGAFNREFIKNGIFPTEFSIIIQALFDDRQTGDYDVFTDISKETASQRINDAINILSAIEKHLVA